MRPWRATVGWTTSSETRLRGRRAESLALDQLIADARGGTSGALVLRGDAGVGKTAMLDYILGNAAGCRVARAAGVESEMELAFAGLHLLCAPFLDRLDRLPGPQRDALSTAFGLKNGGAPDRFLVGLAVLSLLSDVAEAQPLVCLLDDAQWLDQASAQTLGIVARRLAAESVVIVFAVREPGGIPDLAGLPELRVGPLRDADARDLLASAIPGRLDESVRDRILTEAGGNPLALLELPRAWTPAAIAGGFGLPDGVSVSGRIEESFRRRLSPLPDDSRRLLLLAAAEAVGDPVRIWAAAERLRIPIEAAGPATTAGLIAIETQFRFRHPLVRSVVYAEATPADRRLAHAALAGVTDPKQDPDRRAWHLAAAAAGPDEEVALELERSAGRAQARGGLAAAAAFLQRAFALTREPAKRTGRAFSAAQASLHAGEFEAALGLLAAVEATPLDEVSQARAELLHGHIAFASSVGSDAPPRLLRAAKRFEGIDSDVARETYLDAWGAALFAGRFATPRHPAPARVADRALHGEAARRATRLDGRGGQRAGVGAGRAGRQSRRRGDDDRQAQGGAQAAAATRFAQAVSGLASPARRAAARCRDRRDPAPEQGRRHRRGGNGRDCRAQRRRGLRSRRRRRRAR